MPATFGEPMPSGPGARPGRRPAPHARPAGLGPEGPVPAPLSRAARTAGLSLAALGALAGAGGVAAADLAQGHGSAATGEFALPTHLVSADVILDAPAHRTHEASAPAVMPALDRVASAAPSAAPAIRTSSPASRAAAVDQASATRAARALAIAKGQIGIPYVWGGRTPGQGFDCSGLMQWAYGKAGKDLSRSSSAQSEEGERVSMDELRPGDLVFMYSPVSHVAMYAGDGQLIEAPTSGEDVKMTPLSHYSSRIVEARRP